MIITLKFLIELKSLISNGVTFDTFQAKHLKEFNSYWIVTLQFQLLLRKQVCVFKLRLSDFYVLT